MVALCELASDAGVDALLAEHPHALWRGDRLARCRTSVVATGHAALDVELPDHGWPRSTLTELLLPQPGIGEMRLLRPALAAVAGQGRRIALLQPPQPPQIAAWQGWGLPPAALFWLDLRDIRQADALWSAEQILRSGCFGAVLLWFSAIRPEALRRLHLAAQAADSLFWVLRLEAARRESSPAPLRLALHSVEGGIGVEIVKRRGPPSLLPLFLPLAGPSRPASHEVLDRRPSAAVVARSAVPAPA